MRRCLQGRELHHAVAEVLARHLDPREHRAWIVGSEARGDALPGSDVDIAVQGPRAVDLAHLTVIRAALEELPTLRSFDLVDLQRSSESFRREALQVAIPLTIASTDGADVEG